MNNRILFIQNAQLRDELSDREKMIESMQCLLDKAESDKQSAELQLRQEYDGKLALLEENYKRDMEHRDAMYRYELSQREENHRKSLLEKELELQQLREATKVLSETCSKSLADLHLKNESLQESLAKNESQKDWYIQKCWCHSTEQSRLLQNRNLQTRREEKDSYLLDSFSSGHRVDTSMLDTSRRERKKVKKLRLDYSKHKPYTDNPHYIKLEHYFKPLEGERLKMRNGVTEIRTKHLIKMVNGRFEEYFIEVGTVRFQGDERDSLVIEDQVIPGVPFDAEMLSFVLTEHYCFNTTWANLCKKLAYYGVHINDSTLGNIVHRCIAYLRNSMEEVWVKALYDTNYWMVDETTCLVGTEDKDGKKCYRDKYLWGIRANKLKLSWFIYDDGSRGQKVIRPFLDKFKGYFTADGYVVYKMYDKLENALQKRCACLTHIRRPFVESLKENRSLVSWFINKIKKIFAVDSECKEHGLSGEDRLQKRICKSRRHMQDIENKFNHYLNNGGFNKLGEMTKRALKYIQREWVAMKNVLQNGDAELSNNLCEQMMRHIKINLKNSQNIGSEKCAKNFCFMYSLVESCDFNKLSPIKYISHLLKTLHYSDSNMDRRMLLPCYCNL